VAARHISVRIVQALLPPLGAGYLRFVRRTMRLTTEGEATALPADGGPMIYAFWHEQLVMMPWMQFRPPTVAPISRSDDGDFTTELFARVGVEAVRGSSSRDGAIAARGMIAAARAGRDTGLTPDGPRGPARIVQPGATWIARATGCPLLPVAFASTPVGRLRTWDRMLLPLPFARGVFVYGEHLYVPRETTADGLIEADAELAARIAAVTERAETILLT